MKKLKAINVKRNYPGSYTVGPLHTIERRDGYTIKWKLPYLKWRVIRFESENSSNFEEVYYFHTYAKARDHAIMEANIKALCTWADEGGLDE